MERGGETINFCGVKYWNASLPGLLASLDREGGYLVVPAAPALCTVLEDRFYFESLRRADFAVIDSGYVALLMAMEFRRFVARISGLRFMQGLFSRDSEVQIRSRKTLWVLPSQAEEDRLRGFLDREGFQMGLQTFYQAPFYQKAVDFEDRALWDCVEKSAPEWVIICIGGGRQEKLALRLRERFGRKIRIICTGAAIAFFTGGQAKIPTWADRACLGWLFRIFESPRVFLKRYLLALKLPLVLRKVRNERPG